MEEIIRNIEKDVNLILKNDKSGHGIEHINRVLNESLFLANFYDANKDLVSIIALLHDVDDYKIVGLDKANSYDNARIIMNKYNLDKEIIDFVIEAISKIGYSKRLGGISPNSIEAMIVSDADMLDSIGAIGLIRTIEYNVSKDRKIFDKDIFPNINL